MEKLREDRFVQRTQDLRSLPVVTPGGQLVPLESVAEIREYSSGPEQILHRERERAITVQVSPPADMPLELAQDRIQSMVVQTLRESGQLDGGYQINLGGTADKLRATWDSLWFNLALAGLITYLLMAALFESWFYPLVIIAAVPLGSVGGLLGLCPLVLFPGAGSELYRGLGSVLLGGLLVSTLVTIVLVPLLLGLCFRVFETEGQRTTAAPAALPRPATEPAPAITAGVKPTEAPRCLAVAQSRVTAARCRSTGRSPYR